jgi:hypothetical protein
MGTKFWSENIKGRDHLHDLGVDGRTTNGGFFEHGNEPSCTINAGGGGGAF